MARPWCHHFPPPILTTFYRGTNKSILSSCITAWFGNCAVSAEKIIGVSLPSIMDIYSPRCIRKANSIEDVKSVYSCPQCRETFTPRPVLRRHNMLTEVVEKLKNTELQAASPAHCYTGPGDVECDFCTERKHKAVNSCLVCQASYCEDHLKPHYQSPAFKKHKLVEACAELQEKICSEHDKLMEICCTDQSFICYMCTMNNDIVSTKAEITEKQNELKEKQMKSQQRIQKKQKQVQELKQTVDIIKIRSQAAVDDSERIFTELHGEKELGEFPVSHSLNQHLLFYGVTKSLSDLKKQVEEICEEEFNKICPQESRPHLLSLYMLGSVYGFMTQMLGYVIQNEMLEDVKSVYSCPQCREIFTPRPVLHRNNMLAEVVEKLEKTKLQAASPARCYAGPGDVECDSCTGRKHKAVKSCLVCQASYCEDHLKPHYQSPAFKKHKLVEACAELQEKICSEHGKLMEIYCRTDQSFICYLCTMDQHKGHDTVSAKAERTKKLNELKEEQMKFQQRIQVKQKKVQELKQTVDIIKMRSKTAVDDNERIFTELISSMEKKRSEVMELIRAQEKAEVSRAERLLNQLEQEIADLKRRVTELEHLSHTHDDIHFLQSFPSLCVSPGCDDSPNFTLNQHLSFDGVRKSLSDLKKRVEQICEEEFNKIRPQESTPHSLSLYTLGSGCGLIQLLDYVIQNKRPKESYRAWLAQRTPKAAEAYQQAKRAAARVVLEAKTRVWEEFGEAMEKDYRTATGKFWQTVRQITEGSNLGYRRNNAVPSCGTLDQLYTLHRVLEGSWEFAQPVHMCFVDFEKAFDHVPCGILWEVLWEYGVRGPLLRAVWFLYDRSRSLVHIAS
ncbi:hypothetical protein QTP70_003637 [Hemibagrus guttatus]|uniref:B box-type domain-containing protein n=1 Tax=Hemibagrus guttatus TaxID=175788 RepID=A0AAE0QRZ6_9TELE|nr:hypothetical protein QTP70_003637 [Hemibagrus guttatus]